MACPEPSLSGAFHRLGAVGEDKLLQLKHKLKTRQPSCGGAGLLRAMVLLVLGRDTEARLVLDTLRTDSAARLVAHRWAGMDLPEAPEEPLDEAWAVARLYHLLAEEKLCLPSLREAAYHVALGAFRADARLPELQAEARERCGWDVADPGGSQPLRADDQGGLPPSLVPTSGTQSLPQPIKGSLNWSRASPLRSTGSPVSLASNLAISQSPTVALLTQPRSTPGTSKVCLQSLAGPGPDPVPMRRQEPEQVSWPPSVETELLQEQPDSPGPQLPRVGPEPGFPDPSAPSEPEAPCPEQCAQVSRAHPLTASPPSAPQSLSSPTPEPSGDPSKDRMSLPHPAEDRASQKTKPCPPSPSAPPVSSPSSSLPSAAPPTWASSEEKFYSFVVLHARADEDVALRVCRRLEALGVPDGATFCEDFQVPGCSQLSCLQDAIDRSAFTLLLLTPSFNCRLSLHQVSQALMSSFGRHGWQDSVIPFWPLETSQLDPDVARLLSSLVYLDEHSQIFDRKVRSTFKKQALQARKAQWEKEREARTLREHSQHLEAERQQAADTLTAYSIYVEQYLAWQLQMEQLQAALGVHMSLATQMPGGTLRPFGGQVPPGSQPPLPNWLGCPRPPLPQQWPAGIPPAAFPQPPAFPPAPPVSPQSPRMQPLIIHHAQMVQLGLNNHMWGQRGAQAPEDKSQEAE